MIGILPKVMPVKRTMGKNLCRKNLNTEVAVLHGEFPCNSVSSHL